MKKFLKFFKSLIISTEGYKTLLITCLQPATVANFWMSSSLYVNNLLSMRNDIVYTGFLPKNIFQIWIFKKCLEFYNVIKKYHLRGSTPREEARKSQGRRCRHR